MALEDWANRMLVAELNRAWREQIDQLQREANRHPMVLLARLRVEWDRALR